MSKTRLLIYHEGREISNDVTLENGKRNPFGWSQCDVHHNGIALTFARTETRWFWDHIWMKATALVFLKRRLHFIRDGKEAKGNSGAPSVLAGYGQEAEQRLRSALTSKKIDGVFMNYWNCKP